MSAPGLGFTLALQGWLAGPATEGYAWSPYSVASALGLAAAGAAGTTREEIVRALAPDGDAGRVADALRSASRLEAGRSGGAAIAVANTFWADATLPVSESFQRSVRDWPGGAARTADFEHAAERARQEINAEVEKTTHGLIRDLLGPGQVRSDTRAALVNALWLRAPWTAPFPAAQTRPLPFHAPGGDVTVPTMQARRRLRHATGSGWTLVTLPAASGVVADVLLPDAELGGSEAALRPADIEALRAAGRPVEVALWLPKFRVAGQASLAEPLAGAGIRSMFTDRADLSPVTGGAESLKIDAAVHKAVLTIDEAGLEGAAATAMTMIRTAAMAGPSHVVELHVDRPFLVLVRHEQTDTIYFLARITRP